MFYVSVTSSREYQAGTNLKMNQRQLIKTRDKPEKKLQCVELRAADVQLQ